VTLLPSLTRFGAKPQVKLASRVKDGKSVKECGRLPDHRHLAAGPNGQPVEDQVKRDQPVERKRPTSSGWLGIAFR
jgi:hypothetical protein